MPASAVIVAVMTLDDPRHVASEIVDLVAPDPPRAALFVDFDGTLAEIVDDPADARPVDGVLDALDRIASHLGLLAIVSGRPAAFLSERLERAVRASRLRAYGLYGEEELLEDGTIARDGSAVRWRSAFEASAASARHAAPHARIEDKGDAIALHFRERPEDEAVLNQVAATAAERYGLALRNGRKVIELVAPDACDKGAVVSHLLGAFDIGLAFGDDLGDIATFAALDVAARAKGLRAFKVAVGGEEAPPALLDLADAVVASPKAVAATLIEVADVLDRTVTAS
jgi:trehalose 6-phosphate phosphatase